MSYFHVSPAGVEKLLLKLKPHKAAGPDEIHARVLKELHRPLAPVLSDLFQRSIDTGEVPDDWREANVAPVFKKGERYRASNYRPISLTSIVCKLLEHIITSHMMNFLEDHNILYDLQHGFRKARSCESQLLSLYHDLAQSRDGRIQTDLIIMDFAKAFDKVPHRHLAAKLSHYGIRGNILLWIKNFLADRTQCVVVEGERSSNAPVTSGVPQGTVLGPILFLLYINDLPARTQHSTVRLFADDCILQKSIKTQDDCLKLQQDIESIGRWERDWLMEFNPSKCQILTIPASTKPSLYSYSLHGTTLERPPDGCIKYLGVTIQSDLKWTKHIDQISAKASHTLGLIRRNVRVHDRDVRERAYKTLVRPQVEFASSVWDPPRNTGPSALRQSSLAHQVEMVQRRSARFVCSRYLNTSSVTSMLQELSWATPEERHRHSRLCMLYQVVHGLVALPYQNYLIPSHSRTRGHDQRFLSIRSRINCFRDSFFPRTIPEWNALSQDLVGVDTLDQFKTGLIRTSMH